MVFDFSPCNWLIVFSINTKLRFRSVFQNWSDYIICGLYWNLRFKLWCEFSWNYSCWNVSNIFNFECINFFSSFWSDWFQWINFVGWSFIDWNIFLFSYYNWLKSLIVYWNIILSIHIDYMSCIIWNFFNNFLVFENWSEYLWNNCNGNVCNIFNLNSFNFSINFWHDWFWLLNLLYFCWFDWNICSILYLDRLNCFIFNWNKEVPINTDNWIFRRDDCLTWLEFF